MLNLSEAAASVLTDAIQYAKEKGLELITPEVILLSMCKNKTFREAFEDCGGDAGLLEESLTTFISENLYAGEGVDPSFSEGTTFVLTFANRQAGYGDKNVIELTQIVHAIFRLKDSYAVYYIESQDVSEVDLLQSLTTVLEEEADDKSAGNAGGIGGRAGRDRDSGDESEDDSDEEPDADPEDGPEERGERRGRGWKQYAPCINDMLANVNPLIGREEELERTIQILCRKDKNNPLHIGEPGVGKTAITYGLARRINEGKVPKLLIGARIFSIDLGGMLAGTHYRGDFEKRFKQVLEGIAKEEKPIIYIDEIHNLHGAGATGESSYDAANLLKPYLADGHIRFIGATTFEEYKNHFEKSKSLVRRFQNVEIREPSQEETVEILRGLKQGYEGFHGVTVPAG